ncbi:hypothetical protein QQ020_03905 [Fulvivirgaceae bacterium BMA12]|uniref:DUF3575 domain-containing protein n=1 Tax=Agaribacillus aureus TaxID=3051825 RepID=A0ABT8L0A3_9BACT|nr:hypothetical protein [Fulvivirgaceae bacterium BMA12]
MKTATFTFVLVALFVPNLTKAQALETGDFRNLLKLEAGLHGIGLAYDFQVGSNTRIDLSAGLGGGYHISSSKFSYRWDIGNPVVFAKSHIKRYYNRRKRYNKGKPLHNNAGNFVGFMLKYTSSTLGQQDFFDVIADGAIQEAVNFNVHWGIQRPLGRKFLFHHYIGIGYARRVGLSTAAIFPALGLKFSYILGKPGY